jgi:hypothetical protein
MYDRMRRIVIPVHALFNIAAGGKCRDPVVAVSRFFGPSPPGSGLLQVRWKQLNQSSTKSLGWPLSPIRNNQMSDRQAAAALLNEITRHRKGGKTADAEKENKRASTPFKGVFASCRIGWFLAEARG